MGIISLSTTERLLSMSPREALTEFRLRWQPESYRWTALQKGDSPPKAPGIYVWFSTRTVEESEGLVFRYVGESGNMHERIHRRYVGGPRGPSPSTIVLPQLLLAKRHRTSILQAVGPLTTARYVRDMKEIQAKGVEALERLLPGLKEEYRRLFPRNKTLLRLEHAVDFALHGGSDVDALRAVLLEAPADQRKRKELETSLLNLFTQINKDRELPKLLARA